MCGPQKAIQSIRFLISFYQKDWKSRLRREQRYNFSQISVRNFRFRIYVNIWHLAIIGTENAQRMLYSQIKCPEKQLFSIIQKLGNLCDKLRDASFYAVLFWGLYH